MIANVYSIQLHFLCFIGPYLLVEVYIQYLILNMKGIVCLCKNITPCGSLIQKYSENLEVAVTPHDRHISLLHIASY